MGQTSQRRDVTRQATVNVYELLSIHISIGGQHDTNQLQAPVLMRAHELVRVAQDVSSSIVETSQHTLSWRLPCFLSVQVQTAGKKALAPVFFVKFW